jgi:5-methylcytosine-specific restriction endonuclease McrA
VRPISMNSGKRCTKCGVVKPLAEFNKNKAYKDGFLYNCKECMKVYKRTYYLANKERSNSASSAWRAVNADIAVAYSKKYRAVNAEKINTQKAKYRAENAERLRAESAAWKKANPEKKKKMDKAYREANRKKIADNMRRWQVNNKDKVKASTGKFRRANPELYREFTLRRRARRAHNGVNMVTSDEIATIVAQPCAACDAPAPSTVDHVVPIARGGAHSIGNLMPLCGPCNTSKNDMLWIEWINSNRPRAVQARES